MISGLAGKSYAEKLSELRLETLTERRVRFDMVQTYKIIHRVDQVNRDTFFKLVDTSRPNTTRLNSYHLNIQPTAIPRTDIRRNYFTHRVIQKWNSLPNDVKDANTVNKFKSAYDKL